jgi:hypothetical protein
MKRFSLPHHHLIVFHKTEEPISMEARIKVQGKWRRFENM